MIFHPSIWLTAHILGVCIGLGGATVADILFFKFLRDSRISTKEADILRTLSNIILAALMIILATGLVLYFGDMSKYNASPSFLAKMTIVVVLTCNGFFLHEYISPKLVRITFTGQHRSIADIRLLRHVAFALGAVSASSWYFTFFLAMLKSVLSEISLIQILSAYVLVILCSVSVSQLLEHVLQRRAKKN